MYTKEEQIKWLKLSKRFIHKELLVSEKESYDELCDLIRYHEWLYYVKNEPILSDGEYDVLFNLLKEAEAQNPSLINPNSPSQRVAPDTNDDFSSVPHLTPMLSLDNAYSLDDLIDFDRKIKELTAETAPIYVVEPKFDGGTITLVYENDLLVRAATRGNGTEGEEITLNAKAIPTIPLVAQFSKFNICKVELRGEAIMPKKRFFELNELRASEGNSLFANPRNAATGALRMKSPREVADRKLEVFVYQISFATDKDNNPLLQDIKTHDNALNLLEQLGFKIPCFGVERLNCNTIQQAYDFCSLWERKRDAYNYEIDGMVIKLNQHQLQEKAGYTAHHPRWAIAFKFQAKQATTKLLNIEYQVGKIGSITPVAKLEPVQLAGVTISSVSLHNEDFIRSRDLHIGDSVLVERAGDVIPYIVKAFPELRTGDETPILFPEYCPINKNDNVPLIRLEGEAVWRCDDCSCGAQTLRKLIHHVSKDGMDIEGFGESYIERFYELKWILSIADVYNLNYSEIEKLDGFGIKSAEKLKIAIEKAKKNPIHKLLQSLSIHHLGKKSAKLFAAEIKHVLELASWDENRFLNIRDVGPVVANNVMHFFADASNLELLRRMEALGVNLSQTEEDLPKTVDENAPLAGKTILFTGTLLNMTRNDAKRLAENAGAKLISAVSSNLDILVVGEKAGSKLKKAQEIKTIQILTEQEFLTLTDPASA